jgi:hypothetical protein
MHSQRCTQTGPDVGVVEPNTTSVVLDCMKCPSRGLGVLHLGRVCVIIVTCVMIVTDGLHARAAIPPFPSIRRSAAASRRPRLLATIALAAVRPSILPVFVAYLTCCSSLFYSIPTRPSALNSVNSVSTLPSLYISLPAHSNALSCLHHPRRRRLPLPLRPAAPCDARFSAFRLCTRANSPFNLSYSDWAELATPSKPVCCTP